MPKNKQAVIVGPFATEQEAEARLRAQGWYRVAELWRPWNQEVGPTGGRSRWWRARKEDAYVREIVDPAAGWATTYEIRMYNLEEIAA